MWRCLAEYIHSGFDVRWSFARSPSTILRVVVMRFVEIFIAVALAAAVSASLGSGVGRKAEVYSSGSLNSTSGWRYEQQFLSTKENNTWVWGKRV